jgi:metal-dependent amidase/aminoacylase/carboxypeptidase family protein
MGDDYVIPLVNNVELTQRMVPTLQRVAERVIEVPRATTYDDFSFFSQQVPGLYFNVGITPSNVAATAVAPNHSPRFRLDESGLLTGLRALLHVTVDYLAGSAK